jgi:hypothetical protein
MGRIKYADQVREQGRREYMGPARRLKGQHPAAGQAPDESPLLRLWGIGKKVFQRLGGGEAFIRSERKQWKR